MMMKKFVALAAAAVLAVGALAGCGNTDSGAGSAGSGSAQQGKTIAGVADLTGAKIAVQEGTTGDNYVTDEIEGLRFPGLSGWLTLAWT